MRFGIVKSPGVNLLHASDPARRVRTLEPGSRVEIVAGVQWLRVEFDGVIGLVPAAAIESDDDQSVAAGPSLEDAVPPTGLQPFAPGPRFVGEPIVAHVDFRPALLRLHEFAELADVTIHVLRSYATPGAGSGDSPGPATRCSNHYVGHAIDMELIVAGDRLDARRLRRENFRELPAKARYWLQQIRDDRSLRWGGDFVRPDPAHIDDDLYGRDAEQWRRKLAEV